MTIGIFHYYNRKYATASQALSTFWIFFFPGECLPLEYTKDLGLLLFKEQLILLFRSLVITKFDEFVIIYVSVICPSVSSSKQSLNNLTFYLRRGEEGSLPNQDYIDTNISVKIFQASKKGLAQFEGQTKFDVFFLLPI